MRRGFLLCSSKKACKCRSTSRLHQCRCQFTNPNENKDESQRPRRRFVSTSPDLLELETNANSDDAPLLQLLSAEQTSDKSENDVLESNECCEQDINCFGVSVSTDLSSSRPFVLPVAFQSASHQQIVEVPQQQSNSCSKCNDVDNKPIYNSLDEIPSESRLIDNVSRIPLMAQHEKDLGNEKFLLFTNELALLLSRLGHQTQTKDRRYISKHDDNSIFNGFYMNLETEMKAKSFVEKHFGLAAVAHSKLAELWRHVLEPIAQEYSVCNLKKKSTIHKSSQISSHMALGLCTLEYSKQNADILDSLQTILLDATSSIESSKTSIESDISRLKKVAALGVIYLLRCWIRSMSVRMTKWEMQLENSSNGIVLTETKARILDIKSKTDILLKVLPVLERTVVSNLKRTILTLTALDACFETVELSARVTVALYTIEFPLPSTQFNCNFEPSKTLAHMIIWADILPLIDRLLLVKRSWIEHAMNVSNSKRQGTDNSFGSKLNPSVVLLDDWRQLIEASKHSFFDYLHADKVQIHEGVIFETAFFLVWNLAGIKIEKTPTSVVDESVDHKIIVFRLGGIAQSLCYKQECTVSFLGGLVCDEGGHAEIPDLIWSLKEAAQMSCSDRCTTLNALPTKVNQRSSIRSFISWIAKSKKNLNSLKEASNDGPEMFEKTINILISFLSLKSNQCIDLNVAALSLLWEAYPDFQFHEVNASESPLPQLLHVLSHYDAEVNLIGDASLESTTAVELSRLLCNVMLANANANSSKSLVKSLITYFQDDSKVVIASFIDKHISMWRSALLQESTSPTSFSDMVVAISAAIIESPSRCSPISLLSGIVKIDEDTSLSDDRTEKIVIATSNLLEFVVSRLSELYVDISNHIKPETSIFDSISPLLILRTLPRIYYQMVHRVAHMSQSTELILSNLSKLLVKSMRAQATKNDKSDVGKEERRLLAEVAGHCLPFSSKRANETIASEHKVSLFDDICMCTFSEVMQITRGKSLLAQQDCIIRVVECKSALYAVCHYVMYAEDGESGTQLIDVADFAMQILQYNSFAQVATLLQEEVAMLQSGSINFLAVALDSLSRRKGNNTQLKSNEEKDESQISVLKALSIICNNVVSVITTGRNYGEFVCSSFLTKSEVIVENGKDVHYSPQARIAVLNSLVLLSQMNQDQMSKLKWIALNFLPSLLKWAQQGPKDDNIHHPLCIAAGVQVVYTLLAQLRPFDWFHSTKSASQTDFVCSALVCALNLLENDQRDNTMASSTLRMAALKLMMSALAIYKASEDESVSNLQSEEIQKAIRTVYNCASNSDEHPDVQRLASQIVPYL